MGAIEMNKIKDVADAVATFQATGKCANKDLAKFLGDHPAGGRFYLAGLFLEQAPKAKPKAKKKTSKKK